jgi:hypothetical protein
MSVFSGQDQILWYRFSPGNHNRWFKSNKPIIGAHCKSDYGKKSKRKTLAC